MGVKSYRDLIVWQRSIDLVKAIYKISSSFPQQETYGLVSQIRRAAISVPSNIAEGQARRTTGEMLNFLSQAEGSLAEVATQLVIAVELGFTDLSRIVETANLVNECQRMLSSLRAKLATNH